MGHKLLFTLHFCCLLFLLIMYSLRFKRNRLSDLSVLGDEFHCNHTTDEECQQPGFSGTVIGTERDEQHPHARKIKRGIIYLSVYLSICLSIDRSIYPSIHPSIHPSIYLSLSISISISLSIYLSICPTPVKLYIPLGRGRRVTIRNVNFHPL